jgi:4-amino-4-deoxychorismate lyase
MNTVPRTLINGEPQEQVSVRDRGFQYGDGLFETLAVTQGKPIFWKRHMRRLRHGAERLGLTPPPESLLRREADQLCMNHERAVLKIIITRGASSRGYVPVVGATPTRVLSLSPWPDYPAAYAQQGVAVRFCRMTLSRNRFLAGIKHLNRLEQVLARAEWQDNYQEGLMQDTDGHVVEGTMSNVFAVSKGTLLTPDVSQCGVEGVMRGVVIECAAAASIPCRVTDIRRQDILDADEIFLTNSLIGLWPVRMLEGQNFSVGHITRQLQQALHDAQEFN